MSAPSDAEQKAPALSAAVPSASAVPVAPVAVTGSAIKKQLKSENGPKAIGTQILKYEVDVPKPGDPNVYSSWGFPLFGCDWSAHTGRVYLVGGGGKSGMGAASGMYVAQPTQSWALKQLGSLDSCDQIIDHVVFHPTV